MATSSEFSIGLGNGRPSSRVLKPPGGGYSNIFAEPAAELPRARPKYNQQNSSNLNYCMNTVDPNEVVAKISTVKTPTQPPTSNGIHCNGNAPTNGNVIQPAAAAPVQKAPTPVEKSVATVTAPAPAPQKPPTPTSLPISNPATAVTAPPSPPSRSSTKVRQPPGGFSAGLW